MHLHMKVYILHEIVSTHHILTQTFITHYIPITLKAKFLEFRKRCYRHSGNLSIRQDQVKDLQRLAND